MARTQPLVVQPAISSVSTRAELSRDRKSVLKNALAYFFTITCSPGRRPSRGSSSTAGVPACSDASPFCLSRQIPASAMSGSS